MKTHLRHPVLGWPACGVGGRHSDHERTDDPDQVTCLRCRRTAAFAFAIRLGSKEGQ